MTAKIVGDMFNDGIYDLHIELKHYPFLGEQPPKRRERLQARHIMATNIKTVSEVEQARRRRWLKTSTVFISSPLYDREVGAGRASPLKSWLECY